MALLLRKHRFLCNSNICKNSMFVKSLHKSPKDDIAADPLTEFTKELLSKRQLRWEIQRQQQNNKKNKYCLKLQEAIKFLDMIKSKSDIKTDQSTDIMFLSVDFEKLDENHVDHLVVTACRDNNKEFIEKFVDQCVLDNKGISETSVLRLCEYLSTFSDNRTLLKLIELCKLNNRLFYEQNCEFNHLIARSLWAKGNSDGALTLLNETYQTANETVQNSIRFMFRFIIEDTVDKKSEAVLIRLIRSAVLLQEGLHESMILAYIWKTCFLSSWFSDQVVAEKLFDDHSSIRTIAAKRRGIICYNALCDGHVDVVHRLIQVFLKHKMKEECRLIFELLFEYQYVCKDLRACSEILRASLELDINLSNTYNNKLLNLLMGWNIVKPKKTVIPRFDFKF